MELPWLITFREITRCGSITAAARSLGYTQSAVSRHIAALEAATGARLLDRRSRGVELTEHGSCLLPHVEAILNRLGTAQRELDALDGLATGRALRVGAFPTANAVLIPQAMAEFSAKHPEVSLSLVEGTTPRQLINLDLGDVDVAVVTAFPDQGLDHDRFDFTRLLKDSMAVALPRSHRLANRHSVRLDELSGECWIAGDVPTQSRTLSPVRLHQGAEVRIDFQVSEWTAKLGLVGAGLGITLVPSLASSVTRTDIALVPLHPHDDAPRSVYAATAKLRSPSPATQTFVGILTVLGQTLTKRSRAANRAPDVTQ